MIPCATLSEWLEVTRCEAEEIDGGILVLFGVTDLSFEQLETVPGVGGLFDKGILGTDVGGVGDFGDLLSTKCGREVDASEVA